MDDFESLRKLLYGRLPEFKRPACGDLGKVCSLISGL